MRARRAITMVGCHAGGEIGNVIVGGVLPPEGATVFEQMQTLRDEGDALRKSLLREPRGSVACHANLVVPATREDCDAGFIIMEPTEYPAMSGSNTICTTTVLLETGMVEMREPETVVRLEAPGGVVEARAVCRDGKCVSVEFTNVPCFADRLEGLAVRAADDRVRAQELLSNALRGFTDLEAAWEAARTQLVLAEVHAEAGNTESARELVSRAQPVLKGLRSARELARAEDLTERLG